jgi:methyl-accepting chemotaxis protein
MTDTAIVTDEPEMLSAVELILLSAEHRFGRMANALEKAAKAATAGANNVEALTTQVHRLADALEAMAEFMGCITESVEGEDGISRCVIRTRDTVPNALSQRDDRESD